MDGTGSGGAGERGGTVRRSGDWALLRTVSSDQEAELIAGFLRSRDIEAELESLVFHQEPVNFGYLGQVRIWVPAGRLDESRRVLDELEDSEPDAGEDEASDS